MKGLLRGSLRRVGIEVRRYRGSQEGRGAHLGRVLSKFDIDLVLDVGANTGQFRQRLRRLGYRGHVISFEPSARAYSTLKSNAEPDTQWDTYNIALGEVAGSATLHETEKTKFSSLLVPTDSLYRHVGEQGQHVLRQIEVERLDALWPSIVERVRPTQTLLKIDTQGYDLSVVRGATGCLDDIVAVQTEVAFQPSYEGASLFPEATHLLESLGYSLGDICPILHDRETLLLCEADCVFIQVPQRTGLRQDK